MNELLKVKYYKLINNKDFQTYEEVGKILSQIENQLNDSINHISKAELILIAIPLKETQGSVFNELLKDINSGLIYEGSNND